MEELVEFAPLAHIRDEAGAFDNLVHITAGIDNHPGEIFQNLFGLPEESVGKFAGFGITAAGA